MKRWAGLAALWLLCLPGITAAHSEATEERAGEQTLAAVVAEAPGLADPGERAAASVDTETEADSEGLPGGEVRVAQAASGEGPGAGYDRQTPARLAAELADKLREAALENIVIGQQPGGRWFISLENRTYRSDLQAATVALQAVGAVVGGSEITLQLQRDKVAVLSLSLSAHDLADLVAGEVTAGELAQRWTVTAGRGERLAGDEVLAEGASSEGKIDVALRPAIRYLIGNIPDPFESDYYLMTRADSTLWPGWHASLENSTRLTSGTSHVLERATLTHTRWLGSQWLGTATAGRLRPGFYGVYSELQWDRGEHRLGIAGRLLSNEPAMSHAVGHAVGYYEYEVGRLGLTARLAGGRFMESQREGMALSLRRQFGESVMVAEAVRNRGGADGFTVGLTVPMGPAAAKPPTALRLRPDPAFRISYRSNFDAQGDYMQGDYDLRNFRGELTAPWVAAHPQRLAGQGRAPAAAESWPVAPSHEGTSGLMRIPTADVNRDGRITTGISYVDRAHSRVKKNTTDSMPVYISIGFLPNLELIGRLTFMHQRKSWNWPYSTDRSFHMHYRLLPQQGRRPALAVGLQDFSFASESQVVGKAEYLVGSWQRNRCRLHLGAGRHRLSGLFGGVDWDVKDNHRVHLMAEYDTENVNAGVRFFVGNRCSFDINLQDLSKLSGAFTFRTDLR